MKLRQWFAAASKQLRERPRLRVTLWAVALLLACIVFFAPLPDDLDNPSPGIIELLDVRGRPFARITVAEARAAEPLPLRDMGDWLPAVTVALEDHRFYTHGGLDWSSIGGSALRNLYHGRIISGASTISQQVVKLASRREGRLFSSKLYEMCAAMRLERTWSKERILEEYLNRSHYGNRRVGPAAAARAYFGKAPRDLTLSEAIFLAGIPQAPTRYNPWRNPEAALKRYGRAVARLQVLGVVQRGEAARLLAHPPIIRKPEPPHPAPHFADALVADEVPTPGTTVISTMLDLDVQAQAETLLRDWQGRLAASGVRQAAVVILNNDTGGIAAMVGSPDYTAPDGMVNGAILERPCGAILDPLIYAEAIDRRLITASTPLPRHAPQTASPELSAPAPASAPVQQPSSLRPHSPTVHQLLDPSLIRTRDAIRSAAREPAVAVLRLSGTEACMNRLCLWGLRTLDRTSGAADADLESGTSRVRLLEVAASCSGLARGGTRLPARYRQTIQPGGQPSPPVAEHMISRGSAIIVLDMLARASDRRPDDFDKNRPYLPSLCCMSPGNGDAWAVAITGRHTVAVWLGNVDGTPLKPEGASKAVSEMAQALATGLLHRDGALHTPLASPGVVPSLLQLVAIDMRTGLEVENGRSTPSASQAVQAPPASASADLSADVYEEYFLPGTAPLPPGHPLQGADAVQLPAMSSAPAARRDLAFHED